jgi:NitT/TauT family transport system ATP-binding protein
MVSMNPGSLRELSPGAGQQPVPPLAVSHIRKVFGEDTGVISEVIADISFSLGSGEIVSIVGPSGCGKSTLLNLLCGLSPLSGGEVAWYGDVTTGMPKRVGYMLQKDLLLPWRTALRNVTLGLEIHDVPAAERQTRARQLLDTIGLAGFHDYYPSALSGGMRQRVALARTLANEPEVLLLDEPFAALDFQTKLVLESDMARLIRSQRRSLLLITHDIEEAVSLSDRVIVLSHRPARIRAVHDIDIDVDRTDMMAAREAPGFNEYIRAIWSELEVRGRA